MFEINETLPDIAKDPISGQRPVTQEDCCHGLHLVWRDSAGRLHMFVLPTVTEKIPARKCAPAIFGPMIDDDQEAEVERRPTATELITAWNEYVRELERRPEDSTPAFYTPPEALAELKAFERYLIGIILDYKRELDEGSIIEQVTNDFPFLGREDYIIGTLQDLADRGFLNRIRLRYEDDQYTAGEKTKNLLT